MGKRHRRNSLELALEELLRDDALFHVTRRQNLQGIIQRGIASPRVAASLGGTAGLGAEGSRVDVVQLLDLRQIEAGHRAAHLEAILPTGEAAFFQLVALDGALRRLETYRDHFHVRRHCLAATPVLRFLPASEVWVEEEGIPPSFIKEVLGLI
jgi:hypothetical protein